MNLSDVKDAFVDRTPRPATAVWKLESGQEVSADFFVITPSHADMNRATIEAGGGDAEDIRKVDSISLMISVCACNEDGSRIYTYKQAESLKPAMAYGIYSAIVGSSPEKKES